MPACPRRLAAFAISTALGAVACRPSPPTGDDTTSTSSTTTDMPAPGTTVSAPDACMSGEDCETDGHCVAPYDPGSDPPMGAGVCVQACIEANDLARWCFDDQACCGDLRCRKVDGFCEPLASDTTAGSGTDSSGTDSSGSGSSTGGSGSSTGGSGSSTGGGGSSGGSSSSTG